jgi:Flp pilus assembly pilin Flp
VKLRAVRLTVPRGQSGQGLPEYGLILALVGVAAIVGMTFMGGAINDMLSTLGNAL